MFNKYPIVHQDGFKDCGPACLLMIIRYYKGNVSISKIREMTKTGKSGTSLYNLIECANNIGFSARGFRASIDDMRDVVLPCIAHVIIDGIYKHYIVIYNINFEKQIITIADPDRGLRKIDFDDFNNIWNGIIVVLYPIKNLPISKEVSVFDFLLSNIKFYKKELFLIFFISLGIIILKLISSFYFKYIIDGISISKDYLKFIFIIFSVFSILRLGLSFLRGELLVILNSKIDFNFVLGAFRHIILLPYNYYHNRTTGEIISKINDFGNAKNVISKICVTILVDIPLLIISIIFLLSINLKMFIVTVLIFIMYIILSFIYNKFFSKYIYDIKNEREKINSFMYQAINGFETVKGINIESKMIDKFDSDYINLLNKMYKLQFNINIQNTIKDFFNDFGNIFILFLGALFVFENNLNIGNLIAYSSMMIYFLEPIRNIIDMDVDMKDCKESIKRVISLYEKNSDKGIMNFRNGNIEIKNLSFTFNNKNNVLSNLNLFIKKGEKVVFLGNSGSGKSTLLKLFMKYYSVDRNCIFIDGIDINDYKTKSIRGNITYISQNEILFNDTILNNLKFYSKCDNDIVNIARVCEFNEILENELGFNMLIEENGFNLSGGQRQRIVLARSLLKSSDIILIDEGLNQVDVGLERKILTNIFNKYKNKTIIVVTHRYENIDLFDKKICLENGVVNEYSV